MFYTIIHIIIVINIIHVLLISKGHASPYFQFIVHFIFQQPYSSTNQPNISILNLIQVFSTDGTYYRYQIDTQHVLWHGQLPSKLLSFQITSDHQSSDTQSYILPTLDGHFVYFDSYSEILIQRKQVQQLLKVCLDSNNKQKISKNSQFFIYQKYEYYILNLLNGQIKDLQQFLHSPMPSKLKKMAVIKISKKYLKQLKNDLKLAWSVISSQIDLIPIQIFISDPKSAYSPSKTTDYKSPVHIRRLQNGQVQIISKSDVFQLSGKSPVLSIIQLHQGNDFFNKITLNYQKNIALALQDKSQMNNFSNGGIIQIKNNKQIKFPHSTQFNKNFIKNNKKKQDKNIFSQLDVCINTFRALKAIADDSNNIFKDDFIKFNSSIFIPPYGQSIPKIYQYGPTQQQPYIWIALIFAVIVLIVAFILYKIRINSIMKQLSVIQSKQGKKWQQFQKRLGETQQLKKMYEVYWDKVAYQIAGDSWYQHVVLQGRFLNQNCLVFAVRLERADIITIQHKLNTLLNFSHKSLTKLYYYTKNSQFLLIFTQKFQPFSFKKLPDYFNVKSAVISQKLLISQIIQSVQYLDNRIQINCLPFQALQIIVKTQLNNEINYQYKLSAIPCLLKKSLDDSDNQSLSRSCSNQNLMNQLRINLISIFHIIVCDGKILNKQSLDEQLKNQIYSQEQYLQFFDFVLYEAKIKNSQKDIQNGQVGDNFRQYFFNCILDHPYLWNSKRKILFLSDFSNYIQTHIDDYKVKKLQSHAKDYKVIKVPWIRQFHFLFARQITNYRKYDFESVRDLIRVIRNKLNHFHQIPKDVRVHIGETPQQFIQYCLQLFPKLLHFAFVYTNKKKWKLHMK